MKKNLICPHCGREYSAYRNPLPTTDVCIHEPGLGVLLVRRRNPPPGFALPGGFVDEGESCEDAARREMLEETGLSVYLEGLLGVYSSPCRDPRAHTMSVVYVGRALDISRLAAGDDAAQAGFYPLDRLPDPIAFDHRRILADFGEWLAGRRSLASLEGPGEAC